MNILFLDTETTGLPKDWRAPMQLVDNWPRCLQLAWLWTDEEGNEKAKHCFLIKPDGWEVPTGNFWIENGFSQEDSMMNGKPIVEVLSMFRLYVNKSDYLVSHNMDFDHNVLGAEMIRAGMKADHIPEKICTKEAGTDVCKIPFGRDTRPWIVKKWKWPTLQELHFTLFATRYDRNHDAMNDVIALKKCFFALVRAEVITLKQKVA